MLKILLFAMLSFISFQALPQSPAIIKAGNYPELGPGNEKRVVITFEQFKNTIKTGQKYDSLLLLKSKQERALSLSEDVIKSLEADKKELKITSDNHFSNWEKSESDKKSLTLQLEKSKKSKTKMTGLGLLVGLAVGILAF